MKTEGTGPGDNSEAGLPRHLQGDGKGEAFEGDNAGDVLPGQNPVDAALLELKKIAGVAVAANPAPASKPKPKGQ